MRLDLDWKSSCKCFDLALFIEKYQNLKYIHRSPLHILQGHFFVDNWRIYRYLSRVYESNLKYGASQILWLNPVKTLQVFPSISFLKSFFTYWSPTVVIPTATHSQNRNIMILSHQSDIERTLLGQNTSIREDIINLNENFSDSTFQEIRQILISTH